METTNKYELSVITDYKDLIWERFLEGIEKYQLIQPGDKIAVCISGGKDSMLTGLCMKHLQQSGDIPFEVVFLVMNPGYNEINRQKIIENAALLEIPIQMFETQIFDAVAKVDNNPCYLCARMRRGYLYKNAQALGCNKIALGHHFDDVIETIVMGMLYGSQVQTMMPKLHSENYGGMQLIRPMYLVREHDIIDWRLRNDLQFIQCACRFTENCTMCDNGGGGSKRHEVKHLLKGLRRVDPGIDMSIFHSVENVDIGSMLSYHLGSDYHRFIEEYDTRMPTDAAEVEL